jgi:hypothetical protein
VVAPVTIRSTGLVLVILTMASRSAVADWPADPLVNVPLSGPDASAHSPRAAADGAGGAFVAWTSGKAPALRVHAQHVLASASIDPVWPVGGLVVCAEDSAHVSPAIVADGRGGAIIAWVDRRPGRHAPDRLDGTRADIRAQRVAAGVGIDPAWPACGLVVCAADSGRSAPMVVGDGAGGAIVAWWDARGDSGYHAIYAHHVRADGTLDPAWPANGRLLCAVAIAKDALPSYEGFESAMVSDGAGGAVLAWKDCRIKASTFVPPPVKPTKRGFLARLLGMGGRDTRPRPRPPTDIYAQRVTAIGELDPRWPAAGRALCNAVGDQTDVAIAGDGEGGAFVAWVDERSGGGGPGLHDKLLHVQRVLASGEIAPGWPIDGRAVSESKYSQYSPALVSDGGGAFVAWDEGVGRVQRLLASGDVDPAWPARGRPLGTTQYSQDSPRMVSDDAGGVLVAWEDSRTNPMILFGNGDIYAHHVLPHGELDAGWPADGRAVCTAEGNQQRPEIVADGAGGAIVVWLDGRVRPERVGAQRVQADGRLGGTAIPAARR